MSTTRGQISKWFEEGKRMGATHMVVVCDTYDYSDFPIYVMPGEDARKKAFEYGDEQYGLPVKVNSNMSKVVEVYSMALPIEDQLKPHRVFNFD